MINAPISNYYGTPYVYEDNGEYYLGLEDHSGSDEVKISKKFYQSWIDEFGTENRIFEIKHDTCMCYHPNCTEDEKYRKMIVDEKSEATSLICACENHREWLKQQ